MARRFYEKGCHFIAAAILLRQKGGDEYVVLHLICQGVEIILMAILLLRNYAKYQPRLTRYGHRLMLLATDASKEFKLKPLRPTLLAELKELDRLYAGQVLRYSLPASVLIDPKSTPTELVLRRTLAILRLTHRELARKT